MENKLVCIDASVIVKLLTKEEDSDLADELFTTLLENSYVIVEPLFLRIEVYSNLRKKLFHSEIKGNDLKRSLDYFEQLALEYYPESESLLKDSLKVSKKLKEPVIYDSLYLALARFYKALFITADNKFVKKAKTLYPKSYILSELHHFA